MNRPSEQTLIRFFRGQCMPDEQRAVKLYLAMNIDKEYVEACLIKAFPDLSKEHDASIGHLEIERVWNKLEERKLSLPVQPLRRNRWYAYAAAVAFVILSSTLLLVNKGRLNNTHQTEIAWTVISAEVGGNKTVRLKDSSTVILFPGSALRIASAFNKTDRQVKLTGRAFFRVAHNRTKPFYVTAQGLTTKVLGTSFEINSSALADNIITLHTGKISVNRRGSQIALLSPDQQIRVSKKTGHFEIIGVRAAGTVAWLNGELDYDQAPLSAIASDLENWYGVKITTINSKILNQKVTISFKDLPIATVLDMLSKSAEFDYIIKGKQITITERGMETN